MTGYHDALEHEHHLAWRELREAIHAATFTPATLADLSAEAVARCEAARKRLRHATDALNRRDLARQAAARRERLAPVYDRGDGVFSEGFVEACQR